MRTPPSTDAILSAIVQAFEVPADDLIGGSKVRDVVDARYAAAVLLRRYRKMSYQLIARAVGLRTHSVVVDAVNSWPKGRGVHAEAYMADAVSLIEKEQLR